MSWEAWLSVAVTAGILYGLGYGYAASAQDIEHIWRVSSNHRLLSSIRIQARLPNFDPNWDAHAPQTAHSPPRGKRAAHLGAVD